VYPASRNLLFQVGNCEGVKLSHKSRVANVQHLVRVREPRFCWHLFNEFIQPDILILIFASICAFWVAIINIQVPEALGELINQISEVIKNNDTTVPIFEKLYAPGLNLVKKYIFQSTLTFIYIYSLSKFGESFASRLRNRLFKSIMEQDISFFDCHMSGEIVSRLSSDVQDFKSSLKQIISQGLRSTTQIIGCGFTLFKISPKLTYLIIFVLPGILLVGSGLGSLLRQLSRKSQEQLSCAMSIVDEAISNVRTVRAFAMEPHEIGWFNHEIMSAQKYGEWFGAGIAAFQGLSNLAINGVVLIVFCFGTYLIDKKEMYPGDLMNFLISTQMMQKSMANMSVLFGQIVRGMSAGTRVFEYIELRPTMKLNGGKKINKSYIKGDISFKNVKFSYPTRPDQIILNDLNLEIRAGKLTALCGSSGSGKSTIAALIERLYDIESGDIEIDGVNIKELDPSWLRGELIGYINQEPTLFATSVLENIRYGSPNAEDHEVIAAAKRANADGFIRNFPQGYDTVLGERGTTVSGGQKQRIAIARALLKNPPILILDEATSALDAESERMVQDAVDELVKGRTVIVIAHRLSTIQNADLIAAISHGQVAEIGSHKTLLEINGLYAELVKRQTSDL